MESNASLPQSRFEALGAPPGVRLVDPIDGGQFSLLTSGDVDPISRDTDTLPIPVDGVVEIDVEEGRTPYLVGVWIRDAEFNLLDQVTGGDSRTLPDGRYVVEFSAAQLKVYLGIDGPFSVEATGNAVTLSTGEARDIDRRALVSRATGSDDHHHNGPARRHACHLAVPIGLEDDQSGTVLSDAAWPSTVARVRQGTIDPWWQCTRGAVHIDRSPASLGSSVARRPACLLSRCGGHPQRHAEDGCRWRADSAGWRREFR